MSSFFDTDSPLKLGAGLVLNGTTVSNADLLKAAGLGAIDGGNVDVGADELVIPVTHRHVSKTTGSDAEALTLADGVPGQRLTVNLVVDGGGTGTITPATCTGFVSVALADAGDNVTFEWIDDTIGWIITGATGASAPPVIALS